ncbi:MAG: hypothetical protein IPL82_10725 [Elusimicrobia bacterium]|nr:hypothetical protein [Elusimicrobiota bacterium]
MQTRARLAILGAFVLPWAVVLMGVGLAQAFWRDPRCPFASVEDLLNILNATRRLPDLPVTFGAFVHVPLNFLQLRRFRQRLRHRVGLRHRLAADQIKRPNALSYRLLPLWKEMDRIIARLVAAPSRR